MAATVVTVPDSPTRHAASRIGTASAARPMASRTSARIALTWAGVAGSERRWRSAIRTQPIFTLVIACGCRSGPPRMTSVDPPPMSNTKGGAARFGRPITAPRNESSASSCPEMTSGTTPVIRSTPATNAARLATSRDAEVATNRKRSGLFASRNSRNSSNAANRRSRAAGENSPVRSTPSPSRTMRMSRMTSRIGSADPTATSATSSRMALVPQSNAATRTDGELTAYPCTGCSSTTRPIAQRPCLPGDLPRVRTPANARPGHEGTSRAWACHLH